ncbi:MAG: glycosyltransferase family 4 protein [Candidatus Delongbacteria bacterium]|jgi:glycosyltransferase involved in cell wall biosynthesis|nr:glycosyltransferase family 4 protein [Candidatus Delongbacteria bacterium]
MKEKICFIVQEYYPKDARVRKYVNLVTANGYEADVISLRREKDPKFEAHENLNIYRIGLPKKRGGLVRYLLEYFIFFFIASFLVTRLYFKRRYKVIHINTLPDFLVFCALIPKLFGAKLVLDMHEVTPEFFMMKYDICSRNIIIRILLLIEMLSVKYADRLIVITGKMKKLFSERDKIKESKIDFILNVPEKTPPYVKEGFDFRKRFNIVYHGTITKVYNIPEALEAVAEASKKIPHIKYHIYGEGEDVPLLRKRAEELGIKNSVIFHGYLNHTEILEELKNMDIGILPWPKSVLSDISFSNKIAEYISMGIPVIASHMNSLDDYFSPGSIFYNEEGGKISDVLINLYSDPLKAEKGSKKALDEYKRITWDVMSRKYLSILEKLTNRTEKK